MSDKIRYKRVRYYKGHPWPLTPISQICPDWQVVEICITGERPAFGVRKAGGDFAWYEGAPPARCGIYCDAQWRPVMFRTKGGRLLPRLDAAEEVCEG